MKKLVLLVNILILFASVTAQIADSMDIPPGRSCIPFQIALDTANCSRLPVLDPSDQYLYMDLCPGEEIQLSVRGIYAAPGTGNYTQSDATTSFTWRLENGMEQSGTGLSTITHTFTPGMGCELVVTANDSMACPAQIPVSFRVRTSDNPIQTIQNIPQLCVGQTFTPTVGTGQGNHFVLSPVDYIQTASSTVSDTVFLPDGAFCPPYGLYYRSTVTFTQFAPNATLTSANDLNYVRIKMEHSAIEDLKIEIYCPNGSHSTILPHPNFNAFSTDDFYRVNLGSAYRPDGSATCNATVNPMGDPWNYVWSNNTTLGYQYAPGNGSCFNPINFHAHYNPHWDDSNYFHFWNTTQSFSVDSSNVSEMTQIYHPFQSFNSLIGCPLNGNWYIQVQDMFQEDNGYIVEWELALNPQLMPSAWGYNMEVDTFFFTGNNVANGTTIQTESSGTQSYSMTLFDNFGCLYDTTFAVTVLPWPDVSLGEDMTVCPGASVYLSPIAPDNSYQYTWNTGSTATGFSVSEPGTYSVTASVSGAGANCSSSDTFELHNFAISDTTFLRDTICQGYDYTEHGFSMSAEFLSQFDHPNQTQKEFTGIQTREDQHGCDSIVQLRLTVYRHWENEQTVFACNQYFWQGDTLTESGDYAKNFVSQHGCDSTVTLHLSIGHPEENEVWETSCGSLVWNDETFSESGDYTRFLTSIHDCDSAVTLHLTIIDTFLRTYISNPDFCTTQETELSVEGNYEDYLWSTGEVGTSIWVTESGLYSITASNAACQQVGWFHVPNCPLNILLPNAITPSKNEGLNDFLHLSDYDKSLIGEFSIAIYNRWGELVFLSDDKNFRWDGRKDGKLMVNVVYNYHIRCTDRNGKAYLIRGSITVL